MGMAINNNHSSVMSKLKLDIVIVIDTSVGMGEEGLTQVLASISSVFASVPVAQGEGEHSRVGVVTYAVKAQTKHNLRDFKSRDEMLEKIWEIGCSTEAAANLRDALTKSSEIFNEGRANGERTNAKTAILVYASDHRSDTANDGLELASEIKNNGTSIVVVGFDQGGRPHALDKLKEIASPGFFFTNTGENVVTQIQQALYTSELNTTTLRMQFHWRSPDPKSQGHSLMKFLYATRVF
ncbi:von Willebrand factor type A domain protein [Oesophagostomum dentatum]|uniref:von Willebrand factor type A domain protein n=1 Tax=Oesophagostomum dentatum TaxID=61180 RepID=A0A0B1SNW3_OESDE|nr:von Willebrand factor type A domain protein [Oesophagostomum dentatum]